MCPDQATAGSPGDTGRRGWSSAACFQLPRLRQCLVRNLSVDSSGSWLGCWPISRAASINTSGGRRAGERARPGNVPMRQPSPLISQPIVCIH